jgi:hypothetical protein
MNQIFSCPIYPLIQDFQLPNLPTQNFQSPNFVTKYSVQQLKNWATNEIFWSLYQWRKLNHH